MAMTFHVDIVSAEKQIYSDTAEMVFAPAQEGELGIAPRHAPLLTRMVPGTVRVRRGDETQDLVFYVSGGVLEIQPHVVTVLTDTAERASDLDEAAAQEAMRRAQQALDNQKADMDMAKAQAELADAIGRLKAIERVRRAVRKH